MSEPKEERNYAEQGSLSSFAVAALVTRDAFGYVVGGMALLLVLMWVLGKFPLLGITAGSTGSVPAIPLLVLVVSLSFFLGRLAYTVGGVIVYLLGKIPLLEHHFDWSKAFKWWYPKLAEDLPCLENLDPFRLTPSADNARIFFGVLAERWALMNRPDLYYATMTRQNTLRIAAQTNLGVVSLAGLAITICADKVKGVDWKIALFATATLMAIFAFQVALTRRSQCRSEIVAGLVVFSQFPLQIPSEKDV